MSRSELRLRHEGTIVPRMAVQQVEQALGGTPVSLVTGPRRSGETACVRHLLAGDRRYITLDDATSQEAALSDPVEFVRGLDRVTIDEVQRAPEVLRAIQVSVDRLVKTPKLHFLDTGLLAASVGMTPARVGRDRSAFGPLLETSVFSETLRRSEWFPETAGLYHYRDKDKNEVDVVVVDLAGQVVGIEVKASATIRREDFGGLKRLASACGEGFRLGVIQYDGDRVLPFGEGLFAAPIPALWAYTRPFDAERWDGPGGGQSSLPLTIRRKGFTVLLTIRGRRI